MKISSLKRKYQKNKKPFKHFIKQLEKSNLDEIVVEAEEAEAEVWQEVVCTKCANCCKTMTPTLTDFDKQRIADHLNISKKAFTKKYLVYEADEKDWHMQQQPCVFLDMDTNRCTIYEVRPDDCRGFPHLVKKPMSDFVYIHKQNIKYCPATYLWVEKMMDRVEFSKK